MRRAMRVRHGDIDEIDEAAINTFMAGLAGATPRDMIESALALAVLARDTKRRSEAPVTPATLTETLRRVRTRLIEEL
jgi:hypothetical protein